MVWGKALAMLVARPARPPVGACDKKCGQAQGSFHLWRASSLSARAQDREVRDAAQDSHSRHHGNVPEAGQVLLIAHFDTSRAHFRAASRERSVRGAP